jgi:signal peptidase I
MKLPKLFKKTKKKPKCTYASHPTKLGKVWHFLAHEDTWASFIVDAILVVLIGKFLLFPAIGFALDTNYPIVAVVSSSMDHHGMDFDEWWDANGAWYEEHNLTKKQFERFYKSNGFNMGDALVVHGVNADEIQVGDVIVYSVPQRSDPIIHRVISINREDGITFSTKGDANFDQIAFEKNISIKQIHGKAVALAPWLGWPKAALMKLTGQL